MPRLLAPLVLLAVLAVPAPLPAQSTACAGPAYHQFDFFLGDWDTYDVAVPDTVVARNHVTRMAGGCAIRELYDQADGLLGESFSMYDDARGIWHQSWVTNRGTLLLLDGGLRDGRMILTATERHAGGRPSLLRASWWPDGDAVRERAERSTDAGATWNVVFDIVFRPHAAASTAPQAPRSSG